MKKNLVILALITGLIFGLGAFVKNISAQGTQGLDSLGLTVFPAFQDVEVEPGQNTRLQVQFKNGTGNFLPGAIRFADFVVKDEMGTPIIIEDTAVKPKYAASSWLTTTTPNITIPPTDFSTVDVFVNVPEEITACGHYAIAYFEPDVSDASAGNAQRGSAATITPRVGALLNFRVQKPDCIDNIKVTKFETPMFLEYGPIPVNFSLLNLGDVHVAPEAAVQVKNMFGKTVAQDAIQELRIFPEAVKNYTPSLGQKWMIGRYEVLLSGYSKGPKNMPFSAHAYVWVFPWRISLIILLAVILVLIFGRNIYGRIVSRESHLEEALEEEKLEIEKLKEQLKKRKE